jgi:23S rRNA (cytosine1962-C5)-methyltransferase
MIRSNARKPGEPARNDASEYELLDSGEFAKLERVGPFRLIRPAPQAIWPRTLPNDDWQRIDAVYHRSSTGGGDWDFRRALPEKWTIRLGGLFFVVKPTGFGHLGIFPEQEPQWRWIECTVTATRRPVNILNLFAYTGGATLVAAKAGARVCHLDSSRGAVTWARENARNSGLENASIKWMVDDVCKFVRREITRGNRYDAIILDPPTFGRGRKGEVWKIERDLPRLLAECRKLLSPEPCFVLLGCHTPGFTPTVLENLLAGVFETKEGTFNSGEMLLTESSSGRQLPNGTYARWEREEL